MPKLIMCQGLPASGKSTWAMTQLRNGDVIIVDSDVIRREWGGYSVEKEEMVQVEKYGKIRKALKDGKIVISTDPNLLPEHQILLRRLAEKCDAEFEIRIFDTPVEECIARDARRTKSVGIVAIEYWNRRWKR